MHRIFRVKAYEMVPPPMKQMLPQNMQNVMKEVDQ